jgi:hypothetical protein
MKPMIFSLTCAVAIFTSTVFASSVPASKFKGVREFQIKNARFAPNHVQNPQGGTLTVDYTKLTVKLEIRRGMPPCPAGMACIQMIPSPLIVELPLTSIEEDSCGIHHVTAQRDARPVDGALEKIQFEDISGMTCRTFAPVIPKASYLTQFISRMTGQDITDLSEMDIELVREFPSKTL